MHKQLNYLYLITTLAFVACHREEPISPYLFPLAEVMKETTLNNDTLFGRFISDTTQYRITIDTVLELSNNATLVVYNCTPSKLIPCSHASSSNIRLGYFEKTGGDLKLIKLTDNIDVVAWWCDVPKSTLIYLAKHPFILFQESDGHQGSFRNYIDIVDVNLLHLGECQIKLTFPELKEKIDFLPWTPQIQNEAELEKSTRYEGNSLIDSSDFNKGILRLCNIFKIVKDAADPSKANQVTIGIDTLEYKLSGNRLINKRTHIESPEWAKD